MYNVEKKNTNALFYRLGVDLVRIKEGMVESESTINNDKLQTENNCEESLQNESSLIINDKNNEPAVEINTFNLPLWQVIV